MQKRILPIALCFMMVSACAVTGAVSAAPANIPAKTPKVLQLPLMFGYWQGSVGKSVWVPVGEVGKITYDTQSGHWVINANFATIDAKAWSKRAAGNGITMVAVLAYQTSWTPINWDGWYLVRPEHPQPLHPGGTLHAEGTMNNPDGVKWLAANADKVHALLWELQ